MIDLSVKALWDHDYAKALELMTTVRKIAYDKGWNEEYFWALSILAMAIWGMYHIDEGGDLFKTAYDFAGRNMDEKFRMKSLANLSTYYIDQADYDSAYKSYREILDYAILKGDNELQGTAYMNLSTIMKLRNEPDSALRLADRAIMVIPDSMRLKKLDARIIRAEALKEMGNPSRVNAELDDIINAIGYDTLSVAYFKVLSMKAEIEGRDGNNTEAIRIAKRLPVQEDILLRKEKYHLLSRLSRASEDFRTACLYNDSLKVVEDSLTTARYRLMHDNSQIKFILLASESRLERQRVLIIGITCISVLVLIIVTIIIITLRNNVRRHQQTRIIAEQQQKIAELELQRLEERHNVLENELESNNREMTARAFNINRTHDVAKETLHYLESSPLASTPEGREALAKLKKQLCEQGEPDDFLKHFEKVDSRFISTLHSKHPNLNANDVRFIAYIYMQLSNKEISSLLNITPNSCKKRRQRIAAKLGLEDATKLYPYISTL
ncbi:MAG: hypothetical protein K2H60_03125 [Muribaculaceae bacterium]|nr:hypothetical protein [Muribaculaceae bacterium]